MHLQNVKVDSKDAIVFLKQKEKKGKQINKEISQKHEEKIGKGPEKCRKIEIKLNRDNPKIIKQKTNKNTLKNPEEPATKNWRKQEVGLAMALAC